MNILFLTIGYFESIEAHSIYADLLRCFRNDGHEVYVITPHEKRTGKKTELVEESGVHILHIETGNVTKASNLIQKGLAQLLIEPIFIKAIKTYFPYVKFDLVMYSTPPITFYKAVEYVKKRDGAESYLLLKDIFPQNAVDLEMMIKSGLKGCIYKYFRRKEKNLYAISDRIGCMSRANADYVISHNPEIKKDKVEICPNSVEPVDMRISNQERTALRKKYGLPLGKKIFVYGGNLGRPQDVPFIVKCLKACADIDDVYFIIAGSGTDRHFLEEYIEAEKPKHVKLFGFIPKSEYDKMIACCDVGLIFLDHRFTIPNFPSRLLSYMQAGLPVFACTDPNTDVGKVIVDGGFGWWSESNSVENFMKVIQIITNSDISHYGENGFKYLNNNYKACDAYQTIINYDLR